MRLDIVYEKQIQATMAGGLSKSQKKKWYYVMYYNLFHNHRHNRHIDDDNTMIRKPFLFGMDRTKLRRIVYQAISMNSQPTEETFPELRHVIIWMRGIIAIIYGITLGIRNIRGSIMILNIINLITFIPYMYCRFYLNVTMESYNSNSNNNNQSSLLLVGVLPAVALSLLIWIYYFTLHHEMELEILSQLVVDVANNASQLLYNNNNNETLSMMDTADAMMDVTEVPVLTEDSEF